MLPPATDMVQFWTQGREERFPKRTERFLGIAMRDDIDVRLKKYESPDEFYGELDNWFVDMREDIRKAEEPSNGGVGADKGAGAERRKGCKHRPDAGRRVKAEARRVLVRKWVDDRRWNGTLKELRGELLKFNWTPGKCPSISTLSRDLKGHKQFTGTPKQAAKRDGSKRGQGEETEAADLSSLDAYTMPDEADDVS